MRPYYVKKNQILNKKNKKAMKQVYIINQKSTFSNDKMKANNQNKKQIILGRKLHDIKQGPSNGQKNKQQKNILNLTVQFKKHQRYRTQSLKNPGQSSFDDIFEGEIMIPKQGYKKKTLKKSQTKKNLRTQSCKHLKSVSSSPYLSNSKFKFNTIKYQPSIVPLIATNKHLTCLGKPSHKDNPQQKHIQTLNDGYLLNVIKSKFKKEVQNKLKSKGNLSNGKKNDKDCQVNSKNMTISSLSQMLQRCDLNQATLDNQGKSYQRSERMKDEKGKHNAKAKIKEIYKKLKKNVTYMTGTVKEQSAQANYYNSRADKNCDDKMRGFSFIDKIKPQAESNFPIGVQSVGVDFQIKQLLKMKLRNQTSVNSQIKRDLDKLKNLNEQKSNDLESIPQTSRLILSDHLQNEDKSARTFDKVSQVIRKKEVRFDQKTQLLCLLQKYQQMTEWVLPFISQFYVDKNKQWLKMGDGNKYQDKNRKFVQKYNQVMLKNMKYQQIINLLTKDGVDIQKYMRDKR